MYYIMSLKAAPTCDTALALRTLITDPAQASAGITPSPDMMPADPQEYIQSAAVLLNFIDQQALGSLGPRSSIQQHAGTSGSAVWAAVQEALINSAKNDPCVAVQLQVDATRIAADDPSLGTLLLCETDKLCQAAAGLIQQQLLNSLQLQAPVPTIIVSLQLSSVPLPLLHVADLRPLLQQPLACTAPASVVGLVTAVSSCFQSIHSRAVNCSSCGSSVRVLPGSTLLPCCGQVLTSASAEEVLSGRVLLPAQKVVLSSISSCSSSCGYGISSSDDVEVLVTGQQAGQLKLGDVLRVVGEAQLVQTSNTAAVACLTIKAHQVQHISLHRLWSPASSRLPRQLQEAPLEGACRLLTAAMQQQVEAPMALAMLLSAAVVGSGDAGMVATKGRQINLLVLHEDYCPLTKRMLQAAAVHLSPLVVQLPSQLADQVAPTVKPLQLDLQTSAADTSEMVHGSLLTAVNQGVAVLDLSATSNKTKGQISQLVPHRQLPSSSTTSSSHAAAAGSTSCTIWAAANTTEVPADIAYGAAGNRAGKAAVNLQSYDLVLRSGTHEDDVVEMVLGLRSIPDPAADDLGRRSSQLLRTVVANAVQLPPPVLSKEAHDFLLQYVLILRQGLVPLPHTSLLRTLIKVSSAAAQLCGRQQVLEQPDAALAVLLVDHTIAQQLGPGYQTALDLPCGLTPTGQHTLDAHLQLLHTMLQRLFKQYAPDPIDLEETVEE